MLLSTIHVVAQIADEIKSFVDSSEIIVNNGRKLMVSKIQEGNYSKANEIYTYLTGVTEGKSSSAFIFTEDIFLNLLFCDWYNMEGILLDYKNLINKKLYQNTYNILPQLQQKMSFLNDSISAECQKSYLEPESKKIIDLILFLMKNGSKDWNYNIKLEAFHKEYENSRFKDLLDNYLPKRRVKSSMAFTIGSGMVFTTGNLNSNFNHNASVNMSMDFNINRIYSSLYLNSAGLRLKIPFDVTNGIETLSFMEDESFQYMDAGLKGGYFILRNKRLHFAPYVSVSGASLKSKRYDGEEDKKEYKVLNSFSTGIGIHTEIKFTEFKTKGYNYYGFTNSYLSLKLDGGYNYITKFKDDYFKGNTGYFTVALVWGMGDF